MAEQLQQHNLPAVELYGDISKCARYGDKSFLGASEEYVCKRMGNNNWANFVRECLLDELTEGRNGFKSHFKCVGEGGFRPKGWLLILENGFGAWTQGHDKNSDSKDDTWMNYPMM